MKQSELVKAYKVVSKMASQVLPLPVSYKLYRLREKMKRYWDFQLEEEEKLIREIRPENVENGEVLFRSVEDRNAFEQKLSEIANMEVDEEIEPVSVPLLTGLEISMDDIEAVKPVLTFEE